MQKVMEVYDLEMSMDTQMADSGDDGPTRETMKP